MEYKLIIDGNDTGHEEQQLECSISDDTDMLTLKIGYQDIQIDIKSVKALEDLIGLKDK